MRPNLRREKNGYSFFPVVIAIAGGWQFSYLRLSVLLTSPPDGEFKEQNIIGSPAASRSISRAEYLFIESAASSEHDLQTEIAMRLKSPIKTCH